MNFSSLTNKENYLAPSLLAANFFSLKEDLDFVKEQGCKILHLDVMDGNFVPNISFGVPVIKSLRGNTKLLFDTHLMIANPLQYIDAFACSGSNHITFHCESDSPIDETIDAVKSKNLSVGLSLKLATSYKKVLPYLHKIDLLLVMSVEPGFGGQKFSRQALESIKFFRSYANSHCPNLHIAVDGGVDASNKNDLLEAGANIFVAGTSFFNKNFISI